MLHHIGGGRPAADAVELLLDCHARIRSFLDLAGRLGASTALGPDEVAEAATQVRRYFSLALPLHARDEEDSILPRLAGLDPEVDLALEAMRREHREHEAPVASLVDLCARVADAPDLLATLAPRLATASTRLAADMEGHLLLEERTVFPAARRLLGAAAGEAVVREMRARRAGG